MRGSGLVKTRGTGGDLIPNLSVWRFFWQEEEEDLKQLRGGEKKERKERIQKLLQVR